MKDNNDQRLAANCYVRISRELNDRFNSIGAITPCHFPFVRFAE